MKEIADINDKTQSAGQEYNTLVESKIQRIVESAVGDFINYMKQNDFDVSRSANKIIARYRASEVVLDLPVISDRPFGAVATFRVSQTGKPVHVIVAMHKGNGFSISTGKVTITPTDEFKQAKDRLAQVEELIKTYPSEEVIYRAQKDVDGLSILDAEANGTFLEALQVVVA